MRIFPFIDGCRRPLLRTQWQGLPWGLVSEGDVVAILTDIIGDEDHFGDMDFKGYRTKNGITALQWILKIAGLKRE